jgi:hypothetical protein
VKLFDLGIICICGFMGILLILGFSQKFLGDDSVPEQLVEEVIDIETGAKVDLSPNSKKS